MYNNEYVKSKCTAMPITSKVVSQLASMSTCNSQTISGDSILKKKIIKWHLVVLRLDRHQNADSRIHNFIIHHRDWNHPGKLTDFQ